MSPRKLLPGNKESACGHLRGNSSPSKSIFVVSMDIAPFAKKLERS